MHSWCAFTAQRDQKDLFEHVQMNQSRLQIIPEFKLLPPTNTQVVLILITSASLNPEVYTASEIFLSIF